VRNDLFNAKKSLYYDLFLAGYLIIPYNNFYTYIWASALYNARKGINE